eukprot:scaffold10939_cov105-Cylindrotheca_fusiformis.AAC.2
MPFLKSCRADEEVDVSQLSESTKRAYMNEERVKGRGRVVVRVELADISGIVVDTRSRHLQVKWVVRRRVPTKNFSRYLKQKVSPSTLSLGPPFLGASGNEFQKNPSERPATLPMEQTTKQINLSDSSPKYLGDGNDAIAQQQANWRWQSSRLNPFSLIDSLPIPSGLYSFLLSKFVGVVVEVSAEPSTSSSLAMVTVRRLILPEQTVTGRMPHQKPNEVYGDLDSKHVDSARKGDWQECSLQYRIPVEELVVICKRIQSSSSKTAPERELILTHEYSVCRNVFLDSSSAASVAASNEARQFCCRCRREKRKEGEEVVKMTTMCLDCLGFMKHVARAGVSDNHDWTSFCDCRNCHHRRSLFQWKAFLNNAVATARDHNSSSSAKAQQQCADGSTEFVYTRRLLTNLDVKPDFSMSRDFLPQGQPSSRPRTDVKRKSSKKRKYSSVVKSTDGALRSTKGKTGPSHNICLQRKEQVVETCCRIFGYDRKTRTFVGLPGANALDSGYPIEKKFVSDKKRNLRLVSVDSPAPGRTTLQDGRSLYSRTLRANQRRLVRDVAAFGVSVDTLAGRTFSGHESHLRFDRSQIHAWGVFADKFIKENEMLVEYRGEIIGNAVCEKREKEYEAAKIGSDYMFRVDGLTVCDATKQGNVARFINHSCDPNCFTKVISIEGTKRIVVYAKRDIEAGEELSYDYKFPLEYNEEKRIACNCASGDCRGFMNWVSVCCWRCLPSLFTFPYIFAGLTTCIEYKDKRFTDGCKSNNTDCAETHFHFRR